MSTKGGFFMSNKKMMNCPACNQAVSKGAITCPNCGHVLKKRNMGCGCITSIIIFIVIAVGGIALTTGLDKGIQSNVSGVNDESEYISLAEFNQIQTGMSYEDVCAIIGSSGTQSSVVEGFGTKVEIYTWYGNGLAGSNANVTFENGKVSGKAQAGLK